MQNTVDPAAPPPRTAAQIIKDARRAVCSLTASKGSQRRTFISLRARGTAVR